MSIGALRERLVIQQKATTTDSQGGRSVSWSTLATVWGQLVPLNAAERLHAKAIGSVQTYRFRLRTRHDVTPSMRLQWTPRWPSGAGAQTLEISGVLPEDSGRDYILLDCGRVQ